MARQFLSGVPAGFGQPGTGAAFPASLGSVLPNGNIGMQNNVQSVSPGNGVPNPYLNYAVMPGFPVMVGRNPRVACELTQSSRLGSADRSPTA